MVTISDEPSDMGYTVSCLLSSGLPMPKSPSGQLSSNRMGSMETDSKTVEREERGADGGLCVSNKSWANFGDEIYFYPRMLICGLSYAFLLLRYKFVYVNPGFKRQRPL